jgi:phosphonate transport system ATP-binding protein
MAMAAVELRGLSKRYPNGLLALEPLDLNIEAGSFVAVIGSSGAGKSTLIRLINGLESATSGSVTVDGIPLRAGTLRRIRSRVGMVFQQFNLVGRLSVVTNVLTGRLAQRSTLGSLFHVFRREDLEIAHAALARVGLVDKAWERADRLSGGQQQRVGAARALAQQPRLILADEPVASLDPVTAIEIMDLLQDINRRDGITLVVSLHQVDLVRRYAGRVLGLNTGRLVYDGPTGGLTEAVLRDIYQRPSRVGPTVEGMRGAALSDA